MTRLFFRNLTRESQAGRVLRSRNLGLKERGRDDAGFEWQGGSVDFSADQSNLQPFMQYIAGQEERHPKN